MEITSVIIKPKLTEKTQFMKSYTSPKFSFLVNPSATKYQIRNAFISMFEVKPSSINIVIRKPAKARITKRSRYNYKKLQKIAYITISPKDLDSLQAKMNSSEVEEVKSE